VKNEDIKKYINNKTDGKLIVYDARDLNSYDILNVKDITYLSVVNIDYIIDNIEFFE